MKFIHAADLHLDSPLVGLERYEGAPVEAVRQASRRALENLVRFATDEAVDFVLLAGDIYDGDWDDYRTGLFFVRQLSALKQADIKVFLVSGNHDAQSKITRELPLPDNTVVFSAKKAETHRIEKLSVAIHGQSYSTQAITDDLSKGYPSPVTGFFNIGLLHTCANGREGHESYAPCSVNDLASHGYDYWALGHAHCYETLSDSPRIVFPGSIQGRHINEPGEKGCCLVEVEDGHIAGLQFQELNVLQWERCEVDAQGLETPDQVIARTMEQVDGKLKQVSAACLALRVTVKGACHAHLGLQRDQERWINEIRARAIDLGVDRIWIEKVEIRTRAELDLEAIAQQEGPLPDLLRFIRSIQNDEDIQAKLASSFADLKDRMPTGIDLESEETSIGDAAAIKNLLPDVEQLLVSQLTEEEQP